MNVNYNFFIGHVNKDWTVKGLNNQIAIQKLQL
jgi:hypothetical protein